MEQMFSSGVSPSRQRAHLNIMARCTSSTLLTPLSGVKFHWAPGDHSGHGQATVTDVLKGQYQGPQGVALNG